MSAALYGSCSCSPWRMCSHHYAKYLAQSPARAEAREVRNEKRMVQQKSAERRKRARRSRVEYDAQNGADRG